MPCPPKYHFRILFAYLWARLKSLSQNLGAEPLYYKASLLLRNQSHLLPPFLASQKCLQATKELLLLQKRLASSSCVVTIVELHADFSISLPIMFPSIPEGGTKSRVETQVRITMDLAHSSSSDPFKYDRVGSWKWLKLPQGTATKRRS